MTAGKIHKQTGLCIYAVFALTRALLTVVIPCSTTEWVECHSLTHTHTHIEKKYLDINTVCTITQAHTDTQTQRLTHNTQTLVPPCHTIISKCYGYSEPSEPLIVIISQTTVFLSTKLTRFSLIILPMPLQFVSICCLTYK